MESPSYTKETPPFNFVEQPFHVQPAPVIVNAPAFLHGYIIGTEPPTGPLKIIDVNTIDASSFYHQPSKLCVPDYSQQNYFTFSGKSSSDDSLPAVENFDGKRKNRTGIAILVTYILGMFLFFPHLASLILTFKLIGAGQIQHKKGQVIFFTFIEFGFWVMCACLFWGNSSTIYWGFIPFAAYMVASLVCGILRVIICMKYATRERNITPETEKNVFETRLVCLLTYIFGFFFFTHLFSIASSLYLLKKNQIRNRAAVLVCSIFEVLAWVVAASLAWLYITPNYTLQDMDMDEPGDSGSMDYIICTEYESAYGRCFQAWYGFVFIGIWMLFAIAFGIPRVVLTWRKMPVSSTKESEWGSLNAVN